MSSPSSTNFKKIFYILPVVNKHINKPFLEPSASEYGLNKKYTSSNYIHLQYDVTSSAIRCDFVCNTIGQYLAVFFCDLEACVMFHVHRTVCRSVSYAVTVVFRINGFQINSILFLRHQRARDQFPVLYTCTVHMGNI